ncbi:putative serine protease [Paenibacillus sp. 598K]|uniref:S1 family peptidase n=1 Tax=Paenibacillus sp. 598K TaxID=1117987 RepID=UPI000FFA0191|nr:serine protease [Paenibacillus sp. 598K]GBF75822.1 putative serine protease [Paenibacillus sp. 598K]
MKDDDKERGAEEETAASAAGDAADSDQERGESPGEGPSAGGEADKGEPSADAPSAEKGDAPARRWADAATPSPTGATDAPERGAQAGTRSAKVVPMIRRLPADRQSGEPERQAGESARTARADSGRGESAGGKVVQLRPRTAETTAPSEGRDRREASLDPESEAFWEEADEDDGELAEEQKRRGRRFKRIILSLLALALVANIVAFWPRIYNMETLPFLFTSRELSKDEQIQAYKEAVVLISTDRGKGTGFYIPEGYIVTNHHVVEGRMLQNVQFLSMSQTYSATIVASDASSDLAILKLSGDYPDDLPTLPLSEGEWQEAMPVTIIGNPLNFSEIVGQGTVIGEMQLNGWTRPVLALDVPVFKGNSGSPVLDESGSVMAVVFATTEMRDGEQTKTIGLAIPVERVHRLLERL